MSLPAVDPALQATLRAGLALLLVSAARHKLRDRSRFASAVEDYRLLPPGLARPAAGALAALELVVGAALLLPGGEHFAGPTAAGLFVLYGAAIALNLARGRAGIDCGCGGPAGRATPISPTLVGRNAVLVLCALACALPVAGRPWVWLDALSVAGGTAVAALLYSAIDLALAQRARSREVSWSTP